MSTGYYLSHCFSNFNITTISIARFCLMGDSYVKRLQNFCGGDLHLPGPTRFLRQGGLRCDELDDTMKTQMKQAAAKSDYVFLSIGGNDISPISDPEVIFNNIRDLVEKLEETHVRRVYISEILPRGDFSKSKPRGLTKAKFDSDRKAINKLLFKEYGTRVIKFHDIRYPRDYHSDKVHLSEPTQDSKKCGLRKYFFRIRLTFCSSRD